MNNSEQSTKYALDAWYTQITRTNQLFDSLSDEQLQKEVAPGRNTGVYLLGHLAAVHDAMFPLLNLGEKLHPELTEAFIKNPDKSGLEKPSIEHLKSAWNEINASIETKFNAIPAAEWFGKHTAVSAEDFAKEPHRNKLNVLLSRTGHVAYHLGQLAFLK